jgi:hypothetical protein
MHARSIFIPFRVDDVLDFVHAAENDFQHYCWIIKREEEEEEADKDGAAHR